MKKNITLRKKTSIITKSMFEGSVVKNITIKKGVEVFEKECFSNLNYLESVTFPSKVLSFGDALFMNSKSLDHIKLPESLYVIPESTFEQCSNLVELELPLNVCIIGKNAFNSCNKLKRIKVSSNLLEIQDGAFKSCDSLYEFVFPKNLNKIGDYAFYECKNLLNVSLNDNLQSIGDYAFSKTGVYKLVIPDSVKKLGKGAFANTRLCIVRLSDKIENIEDYCFFSTAIRNINIPTSSTYIGKHAFDNCAYLESITIPKNIKEIKTCAFKDCCKLKEIIIESDDIFIGRNAFKNCKDIERIVYKGKQINVKNLSMDGLTKKSLEYLYKNVDKINSLRAIIPLDSLMDLNKKKLDKDFYENAYYKNYRTLYQMMYKARNNVDSQNAFFTLCYTLGIFDRELSHKSSQLILKAIVEKYINPNNIVLCLKDLSLKEVDIEMIKEITNKELPFFFDLIKHTKYKSDFLGVCLEHYREVQKTNISNTNGLLKPTLLKFIDYFNKEKFGVIDNPDDRKLARELGKFYSKKETYDKAKDVLHLFKVNNIKESLISEKIRDEKQRFLNKKEEFNGFIYEFLKKNDPVNFTVGKYFLNCCGHIEGRGEGICIASVLDPLTQTLIMYDSNNNIVSKGVFTINEKSKSIVINAIYTDYKYCNNKEEELVEKYINTFKLFIEDYNKNNNIKINRVYLGKCTTLLVSFFKNVKEEGFSKSINYGKYGIDQHYKGDWQKGQICIYDSKIR